MSRTVNHAFEAFVRAAESVGAELVIEPLTRDSYRVARVVRDGGEFRLTWHPDSQQLTLEVSHGPPAGPPVGWLDLFQVKCADEVLPDEADPAIGFDSSVEYGLELMGFYRT